MPPKKKTKTEPAAAPCVFKNACITRDTAMRRNATLVFMGCVFRGSFRGLDFTNARFSGCLFKADVEFDPHFLKSTTFRVHCTFEAGSADLAAAIKEFGVVVLDPIAGLARGVHAEADRAAAKTAFVDHERDVRAVLSKMSSFERAVAAVVSRASGAGRAPPDTFSLSVHIRAFVCHLAACQLGKTRVAEIDRTKPATGSKAAGARDHRIVQCVKEAATYAGCPPDAVADLAGAHTPISSAVTIVDFLALAEAAISKEHRVMQFVASERRKTIAKTADIAQERIRQIRRWLSEVA